MAMGDKFKINNAKTDAIFGTTEHIITMDFWLCCDHKTDVLAI